LFSLVSAEWQTHESLATSQLAQNVDIFAKNQPQKGAQSSNMMRAAVETLPPLPGAMKNQGGSRPISGVVQNPRRGSVRLADSHKDHRAGESSSVSDVKSAESVTVSDTGSRRMLTEDDFKLAEDLDSQSLPGSKGQAFIAIFEDALDQLSVLCDISSEAVKPENGKAVRFKL
jgi:hypothetical protein